MPTRNQIDRLDTRSQHPCCHRTNPALTLIHPSSSTLCLTITLRVNLDLQLHDISQSLDPSTEDTLTVGLGANPLDIVAGEQEPQYRVLVVQVAHAVRHNRSFQCLVGQRTGRPEVFLHFALGRLDLCCAGGFGGLADELAASRDTISLISGLTYWYQGSLTFLRRYPCCRQSTVQSKTCRVLRI